MPLTKLHRFTQFLSILSYKRHVLKIEIFGGNLNQHEPEILTFFRIKLQTPCPDCLEFRVRELCFHHLDPKLDLNSPSI